MKQNEKFCIRSYWWYNGGNPQEPTTTINDGSAIAQVIHLNNGNPRRLNDGFGIFSLVTEYSIKEGSPLQNMIVSLRRLLAGRLSRVLSRLSVSLRKSRGVKTSKLQNFSSSRVI